MTNSPNFDRAPLLSRQRPEPSPDSLMRTPSRGRTRVGVGELQQNIELFEVLDHRNDGATELGCQYHRFEVAVVLEAIADDQAVRRALGHCHHGQ